jgi:hypothetical protein
VVLTGTVPFGLTSVEFACGPVAVWMAIWNCGRKFVGEVVGMTSVSAMMYMLVVSAVTRNWTRSTALVIVEVTPTGGVIRR